MQDYRSSYYNLRVPHRGATLLFNGKTGALLRLDEKTHDALRPFLGPERDRSAGSGYRTWNPQAFSAEELPTSIRKNWSHLLDAGVFVKIDEDERRQLRDEYADGREQSPLYVTITTTLNCNMRCYYCYQKDDELDHMSLETSGKIVEWIKDQITEKDHKRLYLEWYGGEPMLNQDVIHRISEQIIPFCDKRGITYKASMICNGTNWPADVDQFLQDTRLFRIQFSLDGPERFHNKRRGMIRTDGPGRDASYDEVMETVSSVMGKVIVYFRINVDPMIGRSALEMIDVFEQNGWLDPKYRFYPYVALINAMTEHCGFLDKAEQFKEFEAEFSEIQKAFYSKLSCHKKAMALEKVMYYPTRKLINCAAVNNNAATFGPNGLVYKCGLDVGDNFRAHDGVGEGKELSEKLSVPLNRDRWDRYDPFTHARCSECQYLPVCLGGCPKAQIERNETQIRANSLFFERQFDRMIREYYDSADRV